MESPPTHSPAKCVFQGARDDSMQAAKNTCPKRTLPVCIEQAISEATITTYRQLCVATTNLPPQTASFSRNLPNHIKLSTLLQLLRCSEQATDAPLPSTIPYRNTSRPSPSSDPRLRRHHNPRAATMAAPTSRNHKSAHRARPRPRVRGPTCLDSTATS